MSELRAEIVFDDALARSGRKRIPISSVAVRITTLDGQPPAGRRLCRHVHPFNVESIQS